MLLFCEGLVYRLWRKRFKSELANRISVACEHESDRNRYSFWKPSGLLGTLLSVECLYSWWTIQSHWVLATARVMVKFAFVKDKPQPIRVHRVSTWEPWCDKINLCQQVSICRQNKSHSAPGVLVIWSWWAVLWNNWDTMHALIGQQSC